MVGFSSTRSPEYVSSAILPPGTKTPSLKTSLFKPPSGVSEIRYKLPSNLNKPATVSSNLFDKSLDIYRLSVYLRIAGGAPKSSSLMLSPPAGGLPEGISGVSDSVINKILQSQKFVK